ncbi:peptidoglycan D,D-transpeptidase FtsI family protein [Holospora curviuscula]|uniref:Peptidoglycan synthase FtsI n=1 Tax=Holospora curviuscula TaxID=1082868 RepID=A0A2S5R6P2_9PROT|nr:penicillin-binding transpeptidase domain-containing protein [Holospora curviuscula]PPE02984.1 Peptidoglycan synthase FtsI [Holospora curviuscula]
MFHDFIVHGRDMMTLVQTRLLWFIRASVFVMSILVLRLCWVSITHRNLSQFLYTESIKRRVIMDIQGKILAHSLPSFALAAKPKLIVNVKEAVRELHSVLPFLSKEVMYRQLTSKKTFVWICRQLSPKMRLKILSLGIEGLELFKTQKRVYPYEHLFSHVLGAVDVDQQGISGVEKGCNKAILDPKYKKTPLYLSLDTRLQYVLRKEILSCIKEFQACGGNGILANIHTGEIMAMVSLPDFNANLKHRESFEHIINRNTSGVYEFGSILKIHNLALFLDEKKGSLNRVFDATHPLAIGRFLVKDFKGKCRPLTVKEGFLYSSNIVNGKMALDVGVTAQQAFFSKLSFFRPIFLELSEYATPIIPKNWSKARSITAGYGYGFSITPLHIVQSLQILFNEGKKVPLTVLKRTRRQIPFPSIFKTRDLSQILAEVMEMAVNTGQAQKVKTKYCRVGAKTGTANTLIKGRYKEHENLTSCVAIFPMPTPCYVLLITIDRPKGNASTHYYHTAGWIAAPVVRRIIEKISGFLGIIESSEHQK